MGTSKSVNKEPPKVAEERTTSRKMILSTLQKFSCNGDAFEYKNSPTMLSWNNGQSDTKILQLELYLSGRSDSKCAKRSLQEPRTLFSEQLNH